MKIMLILAVLFQIGIDPNNFNGYLVLAYFVMWLIVVVYVISLVLRQRNLEDIDLMEQVLQEDEESST